MERARVGYSRDMARSILRRIGATAAPVDVRAVAGSEDLKIQEIRVSDKRWSGHFYRSRKTIALNEAHHENRKRFTLAHELGHHFLAHEADEFLDNLDSQGAYESGLPDGDELLPDIEREANEFASELLIPLALIKRDYRAVLDAKLLADQYQVSETAMFVSLLKHHLIKY